MEELLLDLPLGIYWDTYKQINYFNNNLCWSSSFRAEIMETKTTIYNNQKSIS